MSEDVAGPSEFVQALTRSQAETIVAQGKEATILALLQRAETLAEPGQPAGPAPSTPSGMIPPYQMPTATETPSPRLWEFTVPPVNSRRCRLHVLNLGDELPIWGSRIRN